MGEGFAGRERGANGARKLDQTIRNAFSRARVTSLFFFGVIRPHMTSAYPAERGLLPDFGFSTRLTFMSKETSDMDYIIAQFPRRFPNAQINVTFTDDESIVVSVDGDLWTMEVGSDDDAFVFTRGGAIIAFPFED